MNALNFSNLWFPDVAGVTTVRLLRPYNGGPFGGRTPRVIIMAKNPQDGSESRLERGRRLLSEIDAHAGEQVVASLADIAPEFATYLLEFPFGDIYARPGLDLRAREIATIAALTAMGNAAPQLKVHIEAGLNVGVSRQEIIEVIMQMAVYAGFPAALNGLFAAKEVFAKRPE